MSEGVTLKFLRKVGENGDYVLPDYKAAVTWLNTFKHEVGQPVMVSYYSSFDEPGQEGTKINAITAMGIKEYPGPNSYIITSNQEIENSYYITSSTDVPCVSDLVNGLFAICYDKEGVPCYCSYNPKTGIRNFEPINGDRSFYSAFDGFIWFVSNGVIKRSDDFLSRDEVIKLVESLIENINPGEPVASGFKILPLTIKGDSNLLNVDYYNEAEIMPPVGFDNTANIYLNGNLDKEYSIKLYTSAKIPSVQILSETKELIAPLSGEKIGLDKNEVLYVINNGDNVEIFKLSSTDYKSSDNSLIFKNTDVTVRNRSKELVLPTDQKFHSIVEVNSFPLNITLTCEGFFAGSIISEGSKIYLSGDYKFNNYIKEHLVFYILDNKFYIKSDVKDSVVVRVNNNFSDWEWTDFNEGINIATLGLDIITDSTNDITENSTELITSGAIYKALTELRSSLGEKMGELVDDACHSITIGEKSEKSIDNNIDLTELVESLENKSNVLNSESTDTQYPTSKVVYDSLSKLETSIESNSTEIESLKGKKYISGILLSTGSAKVTEGIADLKNTEVITNKVDSFDESTSNNIGYPTTQAVVDFVKKSNLGIETITVSSEYDSINKYPYQGVIKVQVPTKLDVIVNTEDRVDTIYIDKKKDGYKITSNIYKDFTLGVEGDIAYVCIPALTSESQSSTTYTFVSTSIGGMSELSSYKYFKNIILSDYVGKDTLSEDDTIVIKDSITDLDLLKYRNILYTGKISESIIVGNDERDSLPILDTVYQFFNSCGNTLGEFQFYGYNSKGVLRDVIISEIPEGSKVEITYHSDTETFTYKILNPEHYSSDGSVHIKMDKEGKWDYTILSKEIIEYLEELFKWDYHFSYSNGTTYIPLYNTKSGTITTSVSAYRDRGRDLNSDGSRTKFTIPVTSLTSSADFNITTSGDNQSIESSYTVTNDDLKEGKSKSFTYTGTATATPPEESEGAKTGNVSSKHTYYFKKPFFVIQSGSKSFSDLDTTDLAKIVENSGTPTTTVLYNSYDKLANEKDTSAGFTSGNISFKMTKLKTYYWFLIPDTKNITEAKQMGLDAISYTSKGSFSTKYGTYRCYCSGGEQTDIVNTITLAVKMTNNY